VNGPDKSIVLSPPKPGVNTGPITASGGKGRKRPSRASILSRRLHIIPKGLHKTAQGCRSERLPWENSQALSCLP